MKTGAIVIISILVIAGVVGSVLFWRPIYGSLTNTGTLEMTITDPPPIDHGYLSIKSLNVTITQIALRQAGYDNTTYAGHDDDDNSGANETHTDLSAGWTYLNITPVTVDLVKLVNTNTTFGTLQIPAGNYSGMRLYYTQASALVALGSMNMTITLEIPANTTSLKANFDKPLQVQAGGSSTILIDVSVHEDDALHGWFMPSLKVTVLS